MEYCRFVATEESHAHPTYKRKLVEMEATDHTNIFGRARWPNAPQRVLQTPFYDDWKSLPANENESNQPVIGRSTINGLVSTPSSLFYLNGCIKGIFIYHDMHYKKLLSFILHA